MGDIDIDLKKLIDFKGNRYALTKACNQYAKKARDLYPDEYEEIKNKDSILSLCHVLSKEINYTTEKLNYDEDDDLEKRTSILFPSQLSEEKEYKPENASESQEKVDLSEKNENNSKLETPKPQEI